MFTARKIIQDAFVVYPKLKDVSPEEIVKVVSSTMQVQAKDTYNDGELNAKVTVDYIKSNLKGYYFCVVCDICGAKCRKAYIKKVCTNNVPIAKVLCGKCARIKYKRKTREEKRALEYVFNPQLAERALVSHNLKESMIALEAFTIRKQIEDRGEKLVDRLTGSCPTEIIE